MGFFDSLKKGWSFLKAALTMGWERKKLLLPSLYLVIATVVYFVGVVALLVALDVKVEGGQGVLIGFGVSFGSFLIFYFFSAVTVNMIDVHLKGGEPRVAEGARDAGKNFLAITLLAVISAIVNTIVGALRRNSRGLAGIIARVIVGMIQTVWTVLTYLLLPIIIIEDASLGQALRRARDLHKGNVLLIGVGEVGVRLVTGLITFFLTFGIVAVVWVMVGVMGTSAVGLIVTFAVGGTLFGLLAAFNTYVRMAYYTCLYLWAAEVERVGKKALAPGPLGIALGHEPMREAA